MPLNVTYFGPLPRDVQGALVEVLPENADGTAGDLVTVADDATYTIPATGLYRLVATGACVVRCGVAVLADASGGEPFAADKEETRLFRAGSTLAVDAAA